MIAEMIDPSYFRFHFSWRDVIRYIYRISHFIHFNISRICIWLSWFWKISFLFNDPPIFNGHDRTNTRRRPALCFYGYYDGTSWIDGKVVFSISNDASKS